MSDETNSRPALPHSRTAFQDSKDGSIKDNSGAIAQGGNAEVHDRTGLYLAIIAFGFSCMAIGSALILPQLYTARADAQAVRIQMLADRTQLAEREARVMEERWNDLKVELAKRNISVSDH